MRNLMALVLMTTLFLPAAEAETLVLEWEAKGFKAPESAVYDAEKNVFYVSNIDGDPSARDGKGSIARLSPDGKLLQSEWVTGLDAPKGLALYKNRLYVADLDALVEIDTASGRIVHRYASDAKFLNDAAVDAKGNVYVSDMQASSIYRLHKGELEKWLASDKRTLCQPNGLYAAPEHLVVVCWTLVADEFDTVEPGHLKAVNYRDQSIRSLGDAQPIGHIDGLEADGKGGYYLTDWLAGALLHVHADHSVATLLDLEQGSADLTVVPARKQIVIPMMNDNVVRAYRLQ